jgi:hypothetical protein
VLGENKGALGKLWLQKWYVKKWILEVGTLNWLERANEPKREHWKILSMLLLRILGIYNWQYI